MMLIRTEARSLRLAVSALALVAAGAPLAANAQTADQASAQAPTLPDDAKSAPKDNPTDVVVTGSRIPSNFKTPSPVTVITKADASLAGARTVADILQDANVTSGTAQINNFFNGYVSEGGPGANTVGLRGLGSQRTLVLLNGRRLAPAGVGPQLVAADLNVLPDAVLNRIEVLKEGASSIYGSDAEGGVVNLITDTKFNGLTLDGFTSVPLDSNGAGMQTRLSITAGKTFSRGHIMGSFEYREQTAITVGDRKDFSCPTDLLFDPTSGAQIGQRTPDGKSLRCFPFTAGGVGVAQNYLLGISALTTGQVNRYTYANGNINDPYVVNNNDIRPLSSPRQLQEDVFSPLRTFTGYVNGGYDLGILGDAELYAEGLFTRRESHQDFVGQISFDPTQIGFEVASPTLSAAYPSYYPMSSPFFPTSLASTKGGSNDILRVFIVPQILKSSQKVDYWRGNVGLRGNTGIGDFRYDANFQYSRTSSTYSLQNIDTRNLRASLTTPVLAPNGTPSQYVTTALAGELGAGNAYTCASNVTNGAYNGGQCVAGDFFNPSVLAGNLPANLFNYLYTNNVGHTTFDEEIAQLVFQGTLFNLPAGPVGVAFGGEWRRDAIDDVPSEASQTRNLYNYSSSGITKGDTSVWEVYGELHAPILQDKTFAKLLDLSGSVRYTHNDSYGSSTTFHVGGNYEPVDFLRFRGNYGTSFRAPNLYEQFVADQTGFSTTGDPCASFQTTQAAGSNIYKNCLADLTAALGSKLPADFIPTGGGPEIFTSGGGAALKAETSTSWGGGFVFQPKFANLQFAVDYFNTTVSGEVSQLGAAVILDRCYESSDFRNGNVYCSFIGEREKVQGNLTTVQNAYLNIARQKVSGIDFDFRYQLQTGSVQHVLAIKATRTLHQIYQPFAEEPAQDYNGTLGDQGTAGGPKWVGNLDYRLITGPIVFRYAVDYVGPMSQEANQQFVINGVTAVSKEYTGKYFKQDASVQINVQDLGQFTIGVNNLFDRKPETISSTDGLPRIGNYFNYSGYDFYGRTVFVEVTRKF